MSNVRILKSCRNNDLKPMSELVFDSLKTGFPTFKERVTDNVVNSYTHASWITQCILLEQEPFWISDTDIVFYDSLEDIVPSAAITGRYEPAFYEKHLTNCIKTERIHTCLMLIDPERLKREFLDWCSRFDTKLLEKFGFSFCLLEYVKGSILPASPTPLLYDTMAKMCGIVSHRAFTDEENSRFEHVNCGTYSDCLPDENFRTQLQTVGRIAQKAPKDLRGLYSIQKQFYKENTVI